MAISTNSDLVVMPQKATDLKAPSVYDSDGAKVFRAGQRIDEKLGDSLIACYSNMTSSPIIFGFFVFSLACLFAQIAEVSTPVQYVIQEANSTSTNSTRFTIVKTLASTTVRILTVLQNNLNIFINTVNLWIIYFLKPSDKNFYFTLLFNFLILLFSGLGTVVVFILTQCWFLVTQLRNPKYKFYVVLIVGLVFVFSYAEESSTTSTTTSTTASETATVVTRSLVPTPYDHVALDRLATFFSVAQPCVKATYGKDNNNVLLETVHQTSSNVFEIRSYTIPSTSFIPKTFADLSRFTTSYPASKRVPKADELDHVTKCFKET